MYVCMYVPLMGLGGLEMSMGWGLKWVVPCLLCSFWTFKVMVTSLVIFQRGMAYGWVCGRSSVVGSLEACFC